MSVLYSMQAWCQVFLQTFVIIISYILISILIYRNDAQHTGLFHVEHRIEIWIGLGGLYRVQHYPSLVHHCSTENDYQHYLQCPMLHCNTTYSVMRMIINTDQYRGWGMELCCNIAVATQPLKIIKQPLKKQKLTILT